MKRIQQSILVSLLTVMLVLLVVGSAWTESSKDWSIIATYPIPEGASGLAFDGTYLYCGIYGSNGDEVYQIDRTTGAYTLHFNGPQEDAFGMSYDGTYLWVTDHPGSSSIPAVAMQLNMSGGVVSQFDLPDHYMSGIAYDANDFWVATYYPDPSTIYKVDNTGSIIKQFTAPDNQPWDLCFENDNLWMADYWGDALYKIDTATGALLDTHASEGTDPAGIVWDGVHLWYCDNGSGGYDYLYRVDLSGSGTPAINLPVDNHDYGVVTVDQIVSWDATVENTGTADLIISGVSFSGSTYLSCPTSFPITIVPEDQTLIPLVYQPLGLEELNATATIESNDPIQPGADITLTGDAVNSGPDIYLPEGSHDYGLVRNNAYTRWLMVIQNNGDANLTIDNITSDGIEFIVEEQVTFPFDIGVLSSIEVGVWFQPEVAVEYTATLTITNNDPTKAPYLVSVQGTGLETTYPIGTELWDYDITAGYDNSPKAMAPIYDVNGDGIPDVIVCSEDNYIRCLNGNSHAQADVLWEHEISGGSVYSQKGLAITKDVDSDTYDDVVIGSAWGGRLIRTISGRTGETIWTHDTHEYGDGGWVYAVNCSYDYNGDEINDVLAATGDDAGDIGPKRIYCLNGLTGISIWECPLGGPGFSVIGIEDFTGDGQPDVLAGASNEGETSGKAYGINGATGIIEWTFTVTGSSVWALEQIGDITDDGINDVIVGDFNYGSGTIYGLDATTGTEEYAGSGYGSIVRFEKLDDVNSDGHPEIVPAHSGDVVKVINGLTGGIVWLKNIADNSNCVSRSADITGDGINDLMVGTLYTSNYCYFLDGTDGTELESIYSSSPIDALTAIPDIVGDGTWEMVAGSRDGHLICFSGGVEITNDPPGTPIILGPTSVLAGASYEYSFTATDPNGDDLFYFIDWGDGTTEEWIGPFSSGVTTPVSHSWAMRGDYNITTQAKDVSDAIGPVSGPYSINAVKCGDLVDDGEINIADLVYLANYMFKEGPEPPLFEAANMDGIGDEIDIADLVFLVNYMFKEGPEPAC